MGDLGRDTAVQGGDEVAAGVRRWTAAVSADWEIWGPNGGYMASVALRAAGAHSEQVRPASFSGQFLSAAAFDEVSLRTVSVKRAKRAECIRVEVAQGDTAVMEAHVWVVDDELGGLAHDAEPRPDVAHHRDLASYTEIVAARGERPPFRFWDNFDYHPLEAWTSQEEWMARPPSAPETGGWFRYSPPPATDDPFVDAARSLLLVDTMGWPAATRAHSGGEVPFIAPNLDVAARFLHSAPESEWLFCRSEAPTATGGLMAFRTSVWAEDGRQLAIGGGQMLCRPAPPPD